MAPFDGERRAGQSGFGAAGVATGASWTPSANAATASSTAANSLRLFSCRDRPRPEQVYERSMLCTTFSEQLFTGSHCAVGEPTMVAVPAVNLALLR